MPCKYANVSVGYWADFVPKIPGIAKDGYHLVSVEAKQTYADLIAGWTAAGHTDQCP